MAATARKLRIATRLEDLEDSQSKPHLIRPSHQYQEKSQVRASSLAADHCHTAQVLYAKDMQKNYPEWKRWAVNNLYLPLFRFLHKHLGIAPPTGKDAEGREIWVAHQGCFLTRAEADADAARYPHGYVVPNVPLGRSLTADIPEKSAIYFPKTKETEASLAPALVSVREEISRLRSAVHAARLH